VAVGGREEIEPGSRIRAPERPNAGTVIRAGFAEGEAEEWMARPGRAAGSPDDTKRALIHSPIGQPPDSSILEEEGGILVGKLLAKSGSQPGFGEEFEVRRVVSLRKPGGFEV